MKARLRNLLRAPYVAIAVALMSVGILPVFTQSASASLITSRQIQMSTSTAGATSFSLSVSFNSITTGNTQGIVVDFCDDSPIVGYATCTTPAGFSLGTAPTVSGQSSTAGCSLATFTSPTTLNSNRTFVLTAAAQVNVTATPCAMAFTINSGGTGPSLPSTSNHSFYARIYTYDTSAHATGYTLAGYATGELDGGGIALSTAATISITAKVQEQLSLCVYTGSCGTAPSINLGNTQGVLSSSGPYVDLATKYDVQTNASTGAIVNVKGNTLTSGANTITADSTDAASASGTSQFGMCTYESAGANLTANSNYNGGAGAAACNATNLSQTSGTGATGGAGTVTFNFRAAAQGTYGDTISSEAAGSQSTGTIAFLGNTSATQTAGIYTTTLQLIATGTF